MKKLINKRRILYLLFFFFLIGTCYSIYSFIIYHINEFKIESQIKEVQEIVTIEEIEIPEENNTIEEDDFPQKETNKEDSYNIEKYLNVDISELKKINNDVKGWIVVKGTNINYPFVQTTNNSYYLKHSFDKSYNNLGWVFADYRNKLNYNDKNLILYAHNSRTTKMFSTLKNILSNGWLNNKNNHIIKVSTENGNFLYQVFSIYHIPKTSDYIKTSFSSSKEFESFINLISNRSIYDFDTSVNTNDRIITLSTCYGTSKERLVLHAKLINYY